MKTFKVETIGSIYTTYIVSAETEDAARELVFLGKADPVGQEEVDTELHEITEETNNHPTSKGHEK